METLPKRKKCEQCKAKQPAFIVPGQSGNFDNVHSFLFQVCVDCVSTVERETGQKRVAISQAPAKLNFTWRDLSPREQAKGI